MAFKNHYVMNCVLELLCYPAPLLLTQVNRMFCRCGTCRLIPNVDLGQIHCDMFQSFQGCVFFLNESVFGSFSLWSEQLQLLQIAIPNNQLV